LALLWFHRDRVYLRDPIASVYRNNVEQSGVQVFVNGSNDILMEKDGDPDPYRILVQHWNEIPGTPTILRCMRWMACMTDAAHAVVIPLPIPDAPRRGVRGRSPLAAYAPHVAMSSREVSFTTPDDLLMRIVLR
jgi:hypothetical protein